MPKKILIAVNEDSRREQYLSFLTGMDVEVCTVSSVSELCIKVEEDSPSGIILDMPTKLESCMEERIALSTTADNYPACLCKWDSKTGDMKVILSDEYYGEDKLRYFIEHQCRRAV